ncbi:MAG TPA: bifunctional phosphopantothenoylcysteine decarboxylase/phosphopantothenate--cysteine ligase CoaBC [Gemmatimonadaceae bacterium]|nr:bifunctional phosphopantothenoylcysteine decarboxylase/phosphopantothenate--cysteine ligase CoaBC [Gemmatimonadaceae bacterium]HEU6452202.1 bifunctional phosphopantothenoylcysteine decarboxylase/phosphopantothenate--cysteine ligase CoaBC [Gemmatimonadaceae bacterium]
MRPYLGRRILLGVSGGIAAYKAGWLSRLLTRAGAEVDVVMTRAATEFVGPVTFEGLTGRAVHTDIFARGHALDHIRLARAAHAVVVAPATADFMARAAQGRADDLLAACLLATEAPVLLVPAMNDRMWAHPQTRSNTERLREIGYRLLDPEEGMLAAGEGSGPGRMPEPETIFAHVGRLLESHDLSGRSVVVTAGPTREPIDPVRYISNRSSGKMGVALAAAAWRRGASVTLVAGAMEVAPPPGVALVQVESTDEMAEAVAHALPTADALIMAAAPADFRPARVAEQKIKKSASPEAVELAPTRDILASTIDCRRRGAVVVGFALETENLVANARRKLESKGLDLIVANGAGEEGSAFGADTNRVTLISREGAAEELSRRPKSEVADAILDRVEALLRGH